MAISYTVSYTFSPSTTISSSQVNTNFSDNANTWNGIEAETKTLAKLKMDADPTIALEVATKQYVDHYSTWRRPVLQFGSITTVAVESGLDGTSGDIPILFPDGTVRTETSTTRTTFNITRNAVLVTSGAQSGLTGATSEATNTWYALYAVKVTDSSTQWVTVGSTVVPIQANFSTLNTAYGTNGWVYLGMIRNGDNAGSTGDILAFTQSGNRTVFSNVCAANTITARGLRLATTAAASSLTYTYSAGTGTTDIPNNVLVVDYQCGKAFDASTRGTQWTNSAGTFNLYIQMDHVTTVQSYMFPICDVPASSGLKVVLINSGSGLALDIFLTGFVDSVLGVGSNPIL